MFCSKCGTNLQEGTQFCHNCGNKVAQTASPVAEKEIKVMLDPSEVVPQKKVADSSTSLSGHGKTLGMILIIVSIIIDLIAVVSGFIPIMVLGTVLFIVGILLKLFSP